MIKNNLYSSFRGKKQPTRYRVNMLICIKNKIDFMNYNNLNCIKMSHLM